jgi:hypothetical protein
MPDPFFIMQNPESWRANSHPKSTSSCRKSTVDLRLEPLIWGENSLPTPLLPPCHHSFCLITIRQLWKAGQMQSDAGQKDESLIPARFAFFLFHFTRILAGCSKRFLSSSRPPPTSFPTCGGFFDVAAAQKRTAELTELMAGEKNNWMIFATWLSSASPSRKLRSCSCRRKWSATPPNFSRASMRSN